jgi:hypothetical protein
MATEQGSNESQRDLARYSAMVNAWIATRMEKDKTLLLLAAGGSGLLASLMAAVGPSSMCELWLYGAASFFFLVTIGCAIWIFGRNGDHIEHVLNTNDQNDDKLLVKLDAWMLGSFVLGVILTTAVGLTAGYNRLHKKENSVSEQQNANKMVTPTDIRSLTGIARVGQTSGGNANNQGQQTQTGGGNAGSGQQGGSPEQGK